MRNQPANQPPDVTEVPRGFRERILDFFRGNNEKEPYEKLFDLMSRSEETVPRLREFLAKHPRMDEALDKLLDENLSLEDAMGLANDLSYEFGPSLQERHGRRYATSFSLPSGFELTIKLFSDTNDAKDRVLFSIGRVSHSPRTSV